METGFVMAMKSKAAPMKVHATSPPLRQKMTSHAFHSTSAACAVGAALPKVPATVTERPSMRLAFAGVPALSTMMSMESVTMWTTAWVHLMHAAFATVLELSTHVAVRRFPQRIAIVRATSLTDWAFVAGTVQRTKMPTAFATMWTHVLGHSTLVGSAADPERSTHADAPTSRKMIVIAKAINSMPWDFVAETV